MNVSIRNPVLRIGIKTEGALAMLGHDRVFDQPVSVTVESVDGLAGARVHAAGDLRQTTIVGSVSEGDREEILRRKDKDMFETHKFPQLRFEGSYAATAKALEGALTLHGATQRISLPVTVAERDFGWSVEGELPLDLRPFGIKPFKAMLGALRVAPEVRVHVSAEIVRT